MLGSLCRFDGGKQFQPDGIPRILVSFEAKALVSASPVVRLMEQPFEFFLGKRYLKFGCGFGSERVHEFSVVVVRGYEPHLLQVLLRSSELPSS